MVEAVSIATEFRVNNSVIENKSGHNRKPQSVDCTFFVERKFSFLFSWNFIHIFVTIKSRHI